MAEEERVRALLTTLARSPAGRALVPPADLVARARRRAARVQFAAVGGVVVAIAALAAAPLALRSTGGSHPSGPAPSSLASAPTPSASPAGPAAGAAALAADHWTTLPPAPIAGRVNPAAVWDGQQMLIWGGATGRGREQLLADGAAYDPVTRRWQKLPAGPLSGRTGAASVWTGRRWFIWGGSGPSATALDDGATYDPQAHRWRKLPASPLSGRSGPQALWTGTEVVVIGGQSGDGTSVSVAAYNPATNSWRRLATLPVSSDGPTTAVTGVIVRGHLYAWRQWAHTTHVSAHETKTSAGLQLLGYNATANRWTAITTTGGPTLAVPLAIATADAVLAPAAQQCPPGASCPAPTNLNGYRWNPTTGQWTQLPRGPVDDLHPTAVWTGAALLEFNTTTSMSGPDGTHNPGEAAAWNPVSNAWTTVRAAPYAADEAAAVWAGDRLLMWGQMYQPSDANAGRAPQQQTIGLQLGP